MDGLAPAAAPCAGGRRGAAINPRYTFDAFVTGTSNRFAHAAALAVAETPGPVATTRCSSTATPAWARPTCSRPSPTTCSENYPTYQVRYVSTETFLNEFVDAIRTGTIDAFKRRYREIDVLLVDDIQFMEGKEELQEEFFHTFNALHEANRQIVLSLRPPARRHRHPRGPAAQPLQDGPDHRHPAARPRDPPRHPPQEGRARAHAGPDEVLEFIATNITDNIRELEGALIRVSAFASLTGEPLTGRAGRAGARRHPHRHASPARSRPR